MAVKRYWAQSDNTITNAFEENLTTRGTGSNMGASDILEVFSIYAQANSSSAEEARALIKFNATASTNSISADRTAGTIPASGSVSFYLRMFNARHGQTLPKSYTLDVSAISGSWNEGTGMDMEAYKDKGSSNWEEANLAGRTAATATITIADGTAATGMTDDEFVTLTSGAGVEINYIVCDDALTTVATGDVVTSGVTDVGDSTATRTGVAVTVDLTGTPVTQNAFLVQLKAAIESANGHNGSITVSAVPTAASGEQAITLTQTTLGRAGNTLISNNISQIVEPNNYKFAGGAGAWVTTGGDYHTDLSSSFSASFDSGVEDLEVDITPLVEQWVNSDGNVLGTKNDEGVGIFLSSKHSSDSRSYYTKKFFARGTEFFFKKPCIEARWDSATKDDRGNFYYSSSLATGDENLNTIYLYNYFRGQLRNIPEIGQSAIFVTIYSGSSDGTEVGTEAITLVSDGTHVNSSISPTVVTGGYVSTGIYSASFAVTASRDLSSPISTLYDVWHSSGQVIEYRTGSIKPKTVNASAIAPSTQHVSAITNLKNIYRADETARFRVSTRLKDWSPTIYTKATSVAEVNIVESGSYEVYRVVDDLRVVSYGTGSTLHTQMSFDVSGSYFDLDMEMLESGYMYGIRLAYYNNSVGSWVEQPETFKFRVESRQSR
jgi:hypothetical protein